MGDTNEHTLDTLGTLPDIAANARPLRVWLKCRTITTHARESVADLSRNCKGFRSRESIHARETESRAQGTGVGRDIRQSPLRVRSVFLLIYANEPNSRIIQVAKIRFVSSASLSFIFDLEKHFVDSAIMVFTCSQNTSLRWWMHIAPHSSNNLQKYPLTQQNYELLIFCARWSTAKQKVQNLIIILKYLCESEQYKKERRRRRKKKRRNEVSKITCIICFTFPSGHITFTLFFSNRLSKPLWMIEVMNFLRQH